MHAWPLDEELLVFNLLTKSLGLELKFNGQPVTTQCWVTLHRSCQQLPRCNRNLATLEGQLQNLSISQCSLPSLTPCVRCKACANVTAALQTEGCWAGLTFKPSWRIEGNGAVAAKIVMLSSCKFPCGSKRVQASLEWVLQASVEHIAATGTVANRLIMAFGLLLQTIQEPFYDEVQTLFVLLMTPQNADGGNLSTHALGKGLGGWAYRPWGDNIFQVKDV